MRRGLLAALLAIFCFVGIVEASPKFPALTGRVVDNAHLLSAGAHQSLESELAGFEQQTGDQIVVVTVPSLQGVAIEQYGYQLGRYWGIGQKGKDNGALLIVAPQERKLRIEVGYGLEGQLTDTLSSQIIQTIILPEFRAGRLEQGVVAGAQAMVSVLGGKNVAPAPQAHAKSDTLGPILGGLFLLFLFSQVVLFGLYIVGRIFAGILSLFGFNAMSRYLDRMKARIYPADKALLLWLLTPSHRATGSGGGSFFSGGGGSFGGGGSSGSW